MTTAAQRLLRRIENRGYKGRIVSVHRLVDLKDAIHGRYQCGLFDEALYRGQLRHEQYKRF